MASREYFYRTEAGNLRRYRYCICGAGPFKEDNPELFLFMDGNMAYCSKCRDMYFPEGMKESGLPVIGKEAPVSKKILEDDLEETERRRRLTRPSSKSLVRPVVVPVVSLVPVVDVVEPGVKPVVEAESLKASLEGMLAKDIISKVQVLTGEVIKASLKSKKLIIRKALKILAAHGKNSL